MLSLNKSSRDQLAQARMEAPRSVAQQASMWTLCARKRAYVPFFPGLYLVPEFTWIKSQRVDRRGSSFRFPKWFSFLGKRSSLSTLLRTAYSRALKQPTLPHLRELLVVHLCVLVGRKQPFENHIKVLLVSASGRCKNCSTSTRSGNSITSCV